MATHPATHRMSYGRRDEGSGAGVKVPVPPISPVGKKVTGTNAFTPTITFITNTATLKLASGRYALQINSTLQLTLPGNDTAIPAVITLDALGNCIGIDAQACKRAVGQAIALAQHGQENMLHVELGMVLLVHDFLRFLERLLRLIRESF